MQFGAASSVGPTRRQSGAWRIRTSPRQFRRSGQVLESNLDYFVHLCFAKEENYLLRDARFALPPTLFLPLLLGLLSSYTCCLQLLSVLFGCVAPVRVDVLPIAVALLPADIVSEYICTFAVAEDPQRLFSNYITPVRILIVSRTQIPRTVAQVIRYVSMNALDIKSLTRGYASYTTGQEALSIEVSHSFAQVMQIVFGQLFSHFLLYSIRGLEPILLLKGTMESIVASQPVCHLPYAALPFPLIDCFDKQRAWKHETNMLSTPRKHKLIRKDETSLRLAWVPWWGGIQRLAGSRVDKATMTRKILDPRQVDETPVALLHRDRSLLGAETFGWLCLLCAFRQR